MEKLGEAGEDDRTVKAASFHARGTFPVKALGQALVLEASALFLKTILLTSLPLSYQVLFLTVRSTGLRHSLYSWDHGKLLSCICSVHI